MQAIWRVIVGYMGYALLFAAIVAAISLVGERPAWVIAVARFSLGWAAGLTFARIHNEWE